MNRLNVLLLVALLVSSVYLVQVSYEERRLFSELDKAQSQHNQLDVGFERLQAERQAQATPSRVEKAAREKLAMRSATPGTTHYVNVPMAAPAAGGRP
jgi:cell division protein FtsL